jgi:type IV pilus assembly protein PilB
MPLGKVQSQVVAKLEEYGRLTSEQRQALASHPDELSGEALDKLLQDSHGITPFQLLVARAQALGLAPYNVARYRIAPNTFERVPQEFCQENVLLPVGQVGEFLLVAFANPFEVTVPAKIQEMTGKRVVRLSRAGKGHPRQVCQEQRSHRLRPGGPADRSGVRQEG